MADKTDAEKATQQFQAKGTFESELKAKALVAEEARAAAIEDEQKHGLIHGVPKDEYEKLDLGGKKRAQLNDPNSDLRNRTTVQDEVDYQLLSSTNAYTIEAMTGISLDELGKRASELGVSLKGSAAGDGGPR